MMRVIEDAQHRRTVHRHSYLETTMSVYRCEFLDMFIIEHSVNECHKFSLLSIRVYTNTQCDTILICR